MSRKKIKIFDIAFPYVPSCTLNNVSKNIEWDRNNSLSIGETVFFTDSSLREVFSVREDCRKIAWLIEPPEVNPHIYDFIKNYWDSFDVIFTHQESLFSLSEKFLPLPMWCTWIKPENQKLCSKNKDISIIVSEKKSTVGQNMRHQIIETFSNDFGIDLYGRGYNPIDDKYEALGNYRFSIIIENVKSDYLFTEKLIDSLLCGTVPIYWGANRVSEYFDTRGFLIFNNLEELEKILVEATKEKYEELLPIVEKNFETASKFLTVEDFIYENYFDKIV